MDKYPRGPLKYCLHSLRRIAIICMQDNVNRRKKTEKQSLKTLFLEFSYSRLQIHQLTCVMRGRIVGVMLMIGLALSCQAQLMRIWDGEAGDSAWQNALNWQPNGIPSASDTIVLNNARVGNSYQVVMPSGASRSVIAVLIIAPENGAAITLEIPSTNTAVPALQLVAPDTCLRIYNKGTLMNRSTAGTGNPILLTGTGRIENGGKYIHQTLRGNAHIVSRLSWDSKNVEGILEFDVPGNGGYILSVSARQFGTLVLSSTAAGRKTYSGSGNSKLMMWGDLIIQPSTTLNLTLNNQVELYRHLSVEGRWVHAPSASDPTGRRILFRGDSSFIRIPGAMQWGSRSNGIRLEKGKLYLRSPVRLEHDSCAMEILPMTHLHLDTNAITGPGIFSTQPHSLITLGASIGISGDTLHGNVQTQKKRISDSTGFEFTGVGRHATGSGFPATIKELKLSLQGELETENNLTVLQGMKIESGNLVIKDSATLLLKGDAITSCDTCRIKGWLYRNNNQITAMSFPIGNQFRKIPIVLKKEQPDTLLIGMNAVQVDSMATKTATYPLQHIMDSTRWSIVRQSDSMGNKQSMAIPMAAYTDSHSLLNTIARWDTTQKKWLPIAGTGGAGNDTVRSAPTHLVSGTYSLAAFNIIALPDRFIHLRSRTTKSGCVLMWKVDHPSSIVYFSIERKAGTASFQRIAQVSPTNRMDYEYALACTWFNGATIRVVGYEATGDSILSNEMKVNTIWSSARPYPNPASEFLWVPVTSSAITGIWAISSSGKQLEVGYSKLGDQIKVYIQDLLAGVYRLMIWAEGRIETIPFVKR